MASTDLCRSLRLQSLTVDIICLFKLIKSFSFKYLESHLQVYQNGFITVIVNNPSSRNIQHKRFHWLGTVSVVKGLACSFEDSRSLVQSPDGSHQRLTFVCAASPLTTQHLGLKARLVSSESGYCFIVE